MNGKIGFLNISHPDYINEMVTMQAQAAIDNITAAGFDVVCFKESVTDFDSAVKAGKYIASSDVAGAIVFLSSWVECDVLMAAVREVENLPLCLQSFPMFLFRGSLESTGSYVSYAMIKGVFDRVGYSYKGVLGETESEEVRKQISDFCFAASAASRLKRSRIGLVGYTSMSIYTGTFDHIFMRSKIGPEIKQIDSYTLINLAESMGLKAKQKVIEEYQKVARIHEEVSQEFLLKSAGIYLALQELVKDDLDAINVKCQYEFSKEYKMVPCVPLSLLADKGVVASCEGDILNTVSMLILYYLTGQTVTYGDCMNHIGNVVKLSSCGFLPFSLGEKGTQLIRNFMPHPGFTGIQSSFTMPPGQVTVMRLIEDLCDYHILCFTGTGLKTELRQGYMPAIDVMLDGDVNELVKQYSGQHYAICYGNCADKIEDLARILKIKFVRI